MVLTGRPKSLPSAVKHQTPIHLILRGLCSEKAIHFDFCPLIFPAILQPLGKVLSLLILLMGCRCSSSQVLLKHLYSRFYPNIVEPILPTEFLFRIKWVELSLRCTDWTAVSKTWHAVNVLFYTHTSNTVYYMNSECSCAMEEPECNL